MLVDICSFVLELIKVKLALINYVLDLHPDNLIIIHATPENQSISWVLNKFISSLICQIIQYLNVIRVYFDWQMTMWINRSYWTILLLIRLMYLHGIFSWLDWIINVQLLLEIFLWSIEPDSKSAASEFSLIKALQIVFKYSLSFLYVCNGPRNRVSDSVRILKFIARCIYERMNSKVWRVTVANCRADLIVDVPDILLIHLILSYYAVGTSIGPHLVHDESNVSLFLTQERISYLDRDTVEIFQTGKEMLGISMF